MIGACLDKSVNSLSSRRSLKSKQDLTLISSRVNFHFVFIDLERNEVVVWADTSFGHVLFLQHSQTKYWVLFIDFVISSAGSKALTFSRTARLMVILCANLFYEFVEHTRLLPSTKIWVFLLQKTWKNIYEYQLKRRFLVQNSPDHTLIDLLFSSSSVRALTNSQRRCCWLDFMVFVQTDKM